MYKDRDGKLSMGPVWDFNLSMGNTVFYNGWETENWLVDTNPVPFWWRRLLADENFKQRLVKRWETLRKNELATSELLDEIDRTAKYLSEAQKRNFQRWRVLGRRILGNPRAYGSANTYEQEVLRLKTWLLARLKWMDGASRIRSVIGKTEESPMAVERKHVIPFETLPMSRTLTTLYLHHRTTRMRSIVMGC